MPASDDLQYKTESSDYRRGDGFFSRLLGLNIDERHRFSIYDALTVAAAMGAGCAILHTEDLQPGQAIEKLKVQNPFVGS